MVFNLVVFSITSCLYCLVQWKQFLLYSCILSSTEKYSPGEMIEIDILGSSHRETQRKVRFIWEYSPYKLTESNFYSDSYKLLGFWTLIVWHPITKIFRQSSCIHKKTLNTVPRFIFLTKYYITKIYWFWWNTS